MNLLKISKLFNFRKDSNFLSFNTAHIWVGQASLPIKAGQSTDLGSNVAWWYITNYCVLYNMTEWLGCQGGLYNSVIIDVLYPDKKYWGLTLTDKIGNDFFPT